MSGLIQVVQETPETLVSNTSAVKFSSIDLRTASANCFNGWLNYNEGTAQFNIVAGGIYEIDFNTNITSATTGVVALALFADGVQLNGTEVDENITTANNWKNVSFNKKIRVCGRGNVTLTIQSIPSISIADVATTTQIASIKNANISIIRLA